jgi:hypothetical protein
MAGCGIADRNGGGGGVERVEKLEIHIRAHYSSRFSATSELSFFLEKIGRKRKEEAKSRKNLQKMFYFYCKQFRIFLSFRRFGRKLVLN